MPQTITYEKNADPAIVGKIEVARANLKPCCMRCRKNLLKKELAGRVCLDRSACTVRVITRPRNRIWLTPYTSV